MGFLKLCNRALEYLFYSLFLLVPLVFAGNTSELFEFNKMWLTFTIALLIAFFWISKMIILKRVIFKRTIFDIPLGLFLLSQIIATVFSLDSYISFWGYYSRWNGGLLSIITYIFLFYAFVSNFSKDIANEINWKDFIKKSLVVSIISGFVAVLWALPSHFGYDPTCLVFRGHFDTSCWTADFVPTIRIFGPLGQPDWLAGYLGILLPISGAFAITEFKNKTIKNWKFIFYTLSFFLFYVSILYTRSRSGIIASIFSTFLFFAVYFFKNKKEIGQFKNRIFGGILAGVILVSFFAGIQLPVIDKISFSEFKKFAQSAAMKSKTQTPTNSTPNAAASGVSALDSGGTSSLEIRKIVWKGAINIWRANPLFGTGVETYAFAYYKFRPIEHNRVSEWNFLYNKAHNEYLNYLATTGAFGLLSYLFFIGVFLGIGAVNLGGRSIKNKYLLKLKSDEEVDSKDPLPLALVFSFLSILIINFFGFSVVILNIYLLIIPAIFALLFGLHKKVAAQTQKIKIYYVSYFQWGGILGLLAIIAFLIYTLGLYWVADTKYALGYNYNHAGDYQTAYPLLHDAVKLRKEPVFEDEMSMNDAILAISFAQQATSTDSAKLAETLATESIQTNSSLVQSYPNDLLFWKTRVRIFYSLASINPTYYQQALSAIQKVYELSPTDASVLYNLGVLYGQTGDSKKAVEVLEKTVEYKPDYRDAHFALAIFYHDLSVDKNSKIKDPTLHQKAIGELNYILKNLIPTDANAKEYLKVWQNEK